MKNSRERERERARGEPARERELPQRTQAVGLTISHAMNAQQAQGAYPHFFIILICTHLEALITLVLAKFAGSGCSCPVRAAVGGVNYPGSQGNIF